MVDEDELEQLVRYYFSGNYDYRTILSFLERFHGVKISKRKLQDHLKIYCLLRRGSQHQVDDQLIRQLILQELDGPGLLLGYWALWRKLQLKYSIRTPQSTVQILLRELDPEGSRLCQIHCLKRREYLNHGPNYWWLADGYNRLQPYGFPVHGCIDGFSQRILWLKLTKSNNDPWIIGDFFLNAILERDRCPTLIKSNEIKIIYFTFLTKLQELKLKFIGFT